MQKFDIQFKNLEEKAKQKTQKEVFDIVDDVTNWLFLDTIQFSPVRTWKFAQSNKNLWTIKEWDLIIWTVENEVEYAERVEDWFRSYPVNWHLAYIWSTYYSIGADVYHKSTENAKKRLLNALKENYNK